MKTFVQNFIKTLNKAALAAAIFVLLTSSSEAQGESLVDQQYFEAKIRPIFVNYCYKCHGNGAREGSLDLSSKIGALTGGNTAPAVVPFNPGKSLLIQRLRDLDDRMPPPGKNAPTEVEIAELEEWIRRGAPDPRSGAKSRKSEQETEKAENHLFFERVRPPSISSPQEVFNGKLNNWIKNPIDIYVLKELEKQNMRPSLPANKWSLLRRVYFDLIGLPPSYDDVQRFVNGQESYEQVVNRLLSSHQYGERWGRHWLDVARYADTSGNNNRRNRVPPYTDAHAYRDWVINSFNEDKPYDKFLIEQIAADRRKSKHGDLAALGFLTLGPRLAGADEIIDDRIDVITRGIMGLSVYCARCHDHKFDPIPTADYYSLYGVFNSSYEPAENERPILIQDSRKGTGTSSPPPRAMVLIDKPNPRDEPIRIKGGTKRGRIARRQFLRILSGPNRQPFKIGSGRLELAQSIAHKDNPLTARVMVNRIWMHHFGKGIVSSINEFGLRAAKPSHPELLDYLAWYFTRNNWSMKTLHKHILMSNTYQQTSNDNPRYSIKDPNNIYYYKMDRRRLDFEPFRDGLLQVSGILNLTMGGRPVKFPNYRRTVYALVDRRNLDEMFKAFDFPNPNSTGGQRFFSTVSQQALFMMNSSMLTDLTHRMVSRKEFTNIRDDRSRIVTLYNMVYQRNPKPIELKLAQRFLLKQNGGVQNGAMQAQTWANGYGQCDPVDVKNKSYTVIFRPFPFTDGKVWKGNTPAFGPLKLTGTGGHPGTQPNVAVIRRWIAPRDTIVNISGRLEHQLDDEAKAIYNSRFNGITRKWYDQNAWDGVTGIMVVTTVGQRIGREIWRSNAIHGRRNANVANIQVSRGDTIDFIVTSNGYLTPIRRREITKVFQLNNPQQDDFTWNPTIKVRPDIAKGTKQRTDRMLVASWRASEEFQGAVYKPKPLNAWEK